MTLDDRLDEQFKRMDGTTVLPIYNRPTAIGQAKEAILSDLLEIIGADKPLDVEQGVSRYDPNGKDMWGNHYADLVNGSIEAKNILRQELRQRVREYCE